MFSCFSISSSISDDDGVVDDCCYLFLGFHKKNKKLQKIKIKKYSEEIQKIILVRKGC